MKSCKKASYLMSKKLDTDLALMDRLSLRMHLMMCSKCSRCNRQMGFLHETCRKRDQSEQN
jgi:predicted anti-sigma-YlaC factor YlaD